MSSARQVRSWRGWLCCASWCAALCPVVAGGAQGTALDGYLAGLTTWSAEFSQRVLDEAGKQIDTGTGRLIIVRPGKFRWESKPADARQVAQLMVADGCSLWSLDYDLESVTVKPLRDALAQSPAMLLVGQTGLRDAFDVAADGRRDGFNWVKVEPRDAQSDFREARFGFRANELARLVIIDKLGQRSTLTFSAVRRNAKVDPALVKFTLPEGFDQIGKPVCP
jgi:outer membrane lipoprotein carrier protein